jgi:DNA-binding MarR family transcriptional regulator
MQLHAVAGESAVEPGAAWVGRLARVNRLVQRHLAPRSSVSLPQAGVLALLDTEGGMAVSDLAARRGCTQPAMSQMVERLVAAGLAGRAASDRDRRVAVVSVTARGREVLAENRNRAAAVLDERIARLSPADRAVLATAGPVLDRLCDDETDHPVGHDEHVAGTGQERS